MGKVITFGEIMLRLATPGNLRFAQTDNLSATFGGGEANVAVSLANYGIESEYVTRVPNNDIGNWCLSELRKLGVCVDNVLYGGDRLGIYYLETGAISRSSKVVYDRTHSSISEIKPGMINWREIFDGATWFHWSGITPAISESAADVCLEALKVAKEMELTISCDLNYRSKLWKWGKSASEVMPELVEYCDIIMGNEEDADKVFGIKAENFDASRSGANFDRSKFENVCNELSQKFPNSQKIVLTIRGSINANHNSWSAMLYDGINIYKSAEYDITHIVDRVGAGDAFMGGLIYGLLKYEGSQQALDFATAASCLKHSIYGDFNRVTVAEVESLMSGNKSGRVNR